MVLDTETMDRIVNVVKRLPESDYTWYKQSPYRQVFPSHTLIDHLKFCKIEGFVPDIPTFIYAYREMQENYFDFINKLIQDWGSLDALANEWKNEPDDTETSWLCDYVDRVSGLGAPCRDVLKNQPGSNGRKIMICDSILSIGISSLRERILPRRDGVTARRSKQTVDLNEAAKRDMEIENEAFKEFVDEERTEYDPLAEMISQRIASGVKVGGGSRDHEIRWDEVNEKFLNLMGPGTSLEPKEAIDALRAFEYSCDHSQGNDLASRDRVIRVLNKLSTPEIEKFVVESKDWLSEFIRKVVPWVILPPEKTPIDMIQTRRRLKTALLGVAQPYLLSKVALRFLKKTAVEMGYWIPPPGSAGEKTISVGAIIIYYIAECHIYKHRPWLLFRPR